MRAHLEELRRFSWCPAFHVLSRSLVSLKIPFNKEEIVSSLIRRIYVERTIKKQDPDWRTVIHWVDSIAYKDVDYEVGRKRAEELLLPVSKWYNQKFIAQIEEEEAFPDLPLEVEVGIHSIYTVVPVVKLGEIPTAVIFGKKNLSQIELMNDLVARGTGYLLSKELNVKTVRVEYIYVGSMSGLDSTTIEVRAKHNERIERTLRELTVSMASGVSYPSRTSMCNSCQFLKDCVL